MKPDLLISIILPAFNSEKYISKAIESVINQSYRNWKLILIDDFSTDKTFSIMQRYAENDSRISLYRNTQNFGVGFTRNRGVQIADSEWIAFIDSDDMWEINKLEEQINLLYKYPEAKLLFTSSSFIAENGVPFDYILHVPEQIDRKKLLKQNLIPCPSVLVSREYMVKFPMPESRQIHEDFATWLKILEVEEYAYGLNEPLLICRRFNGSKSGNKFKSAKMNWKTYRFIGLSVIQSIYYMGCYTLNGIKKYRNFR